MGYRSDGAIWLPEETYAKLPDELKADLAKDWTQADDNDEVWTFDHWKWYSSYPSVAAWIAFMDSLEDDQYDFVRIGEDSDDIEIATHEKFSVSTNYHYD